MEKEEDKKKAGEGKDGPPPIAEVMFEDRARDPDEAVVAEDAIRGFMARRLAEWHEQMDAAIDALEAWVQTQDEAARAVFSERGYFDALGDRFEGQLYDVAGGKGTPLMDYVVAEMHGTISFAQHAESDLSGFIYHLRRGVRDATWTLRDNVSAVLSNEWPQLLDLAYEGSFDFIPMLHALGLPTMAFKPQEFGDNLVAHADAYRKAVQPAKQEAVEKVPNEEKKAEIEEESKRLSMDEELKKQQMQQTQAATM